MGGGVQKGQERGEATKTPQNQNTAKPIYLSLHYEKATHRHTGSYGLYLESNTIKQRFGELLKKLSEEGKVVLLIDEYDKPLIDYLDDLDTAKDNQKTLNSIIKDSDPYLRFLLVTGVYKFSKVSIFSDLNNLQDITVHPAYNELCGYTQPELEHYFEDRIEQLCKQRA